MRKQNLSGQPPAPTAPPPHLQQAADERHRALLHLLRHVAPRFIALGPLDLGAPHEEREERGQAAHLDQAVAGGGAAGGVGGWWVVQLGVGGRAPVWRVGLRSDEQPAASNHQEPGRLCVAHAAVAHRVQAKSSALMAP